MNDYKTLCILGRQPALGLAELESLFGPEHVRPIAGAALLDIPAEEVNFKRLGGTIKTARLLSVLDSNDWRTTSTYLKKAVPSHLRHLPEGKLTLGLSVYNLSITPNDINKLGLELKKIVTKTGRPCRVVPNKTAELNSAQVLHNKLTHRGAWELLILADGRSIYIAQTLFVQDIEAYAARDQARPKRDSRVGMLPPKLAQMLINLANPPEGARVLDPFCGTGVVLQEALVMGFSVIGSDIEAKMVDYTTYNLKWLFERFPELQGSVDVELGDATSFMWPRFSCVVSEVFLGRPLNFLPNQDQLKQIISDANVITKKFLKNLSEQLKPGQKVVLAVPAWRTPGGQLIHLPALANLTEMGYAYLDLKHVPREELVYFREDQVVARQIIRLEKS